MKYFVIIIIVSAYFLIGCEKTGNPDPDEIVDEISEVNAYSLLKTGNFWVYQTYSCYDTEGKNCSERSIDSVYVSKDTIINGKRYYKFEGTNFGRYFVKFLRDSSDYIVDEKNKKLFSCIDIDNTIREDYYVLNTDTLAKLTYKMVECDARISVPVGVFDALNCKGKVYRIQDDCNIPFYIDYYYAKNIGIIKQNSFYLNSLNRIFKELIRYNVSN